MRQAHPCGRGPEETAMENSFDELSKALAGGISRREAFRRAGGLLAGAMLASLGLERFARAAPIDCDQACSKSQMRAVCLRTDCANFTGAALQACLVDCIRIRKRNCRVDCNTCRRW